MKKTCKETKINIVTQEHNPQPHQESTSKIFHDSTITREDRTALQSKINEEEDKHSKEIIKERRDSWRKTEKNSQPGKFDTIKPKTIKITAQHLLCTEPLSAAPHQSFKFPTADNPSNPSTSILCYNSIINNTRVTENKEDSQPDSSRTAVPLCTT
ncbi:hypothetical protein Drorol1_Dr00023496 [Drosera rotundifolia]